MGKNRRSVFSVTDTRTGEEVMVDSKEEVLVYKWLLHAMQIGIVDGFVYQPTTFQLSDPVKYRDSKGKERSLFREHVYSPDFTIDFDPLKYRNLMDEFKHIHDGKTAYIDVKGGFNRTQRSFTTDRKWVFQKYGIYIYELKPKDFFRKFGILKEFMFTDKTKKPSKVFEGYPIVDDIFKK